MSAVCVGRALRSAPSRSTCARFPALLACLPPNKVFTGRRDSVSGSAKYKYSCHALCLPLSHSLFLPFFIYLSLSGVSTRACVCVLVVDSFFRSCNIFSFTLLLSVCISRLSHY